MDVSGNRCLFIEVEIAQQSFMNDSQRFGLVKNSSRCSQAVEIKSISGFQMQIAFRAEDANYLLLLGHHVRQIYLHILNIRSIGHRQSARREASR